MTYAAIVDVDAEVNCTSEAKVLRGRANSSICEEERHGDLLKSGAHSGVRRWLLTSAPMTIVYLRPRNLVLHRKPANTGPKIPHVLVIM